MTKRIALALLLMLLGGCATSIAEINQDAWNSPNITDAEVQRRFAKCEYEIRMFVFSAPNGVLAALESGRLRNLCLKSNGFVLRPGYQPAARSTDNSWDVGP